jgi:iron(III) transport system permease protein
MKNILRYLLHALVFILIFLPILYLIFSLFFPNYSLASISSLWEYFRFSFDSRIITILIRSIIIAVSTALAATLIGFVLSILLEYTNISGKKILRILLFLPFLIPAHIIAFSWLGFLGKRGTFSNIVFPHLTLNIYNPVTYVFFLVLAFFPIAMLVISLGMSNIDRNLVDAGRISKNKKVMRKIIFPLVKPHILFSLLIIFVLAISEFSIAGFLRVNVYSNEIFAQLASFYDIRTAIFYSLPLLAISLAISFFLYRYLKRNSFTTISSFSREKKNFIELSSLKKGLSYSFMSIMILLSLVIPLVVMIIESQSSFLAAFNTATDSIQNSLLIILISVPIISLLGFITYYAYRKSNFLIPLIIFPLAIPSAVMGISLINLYNTIPLPIYGTIMMVVLGYIIRFLPFSIFIFLAFSSQLSKSIEESAKLSGPSSMKLFSKIIIPLTKNGFLASIFIVSIFCLGEVGITQMVAPPGFQTLSNRIDTLMHYGNYAYVASLSLLLLSFIFLLYGLYLVVYSYGRKN